MSKKPDEGLAAPEKTDKPEERVASALGSAKGSQENMEENDIPPYSALVPEFWKSKCTEFAGLHVIKYPRIFQALIYLLHFHTREQICERETNKLQWKNTATFMINNSPESIFYKMNEYWPIGPKEGEYKEYQKLKFIRENLEGVNEEDVDEYSITLGKIYRWLLMALELRIEDVTNRKKQKEKEREYRADAMEREAERVERFGTQLQEEKDAFEAKLEAEREAKEAKEEEEDAPKEDEEPEPEFDEEEFKLKFDEENPPIEEPVEVVDDLDNDFNIEVEDEEAEWL